MLDVKFNELKLKMESGLEHERKLANELRAEVIHSENEV